MHKSIVHIFLIFLLVGIGCKSNNKYDSESVWFLKNEEDINDELNKRITEDTTLGWDEKSIVVTIYDTTILGAFAKRINNLSNTLIIEYKFSKNLNQKKIITILSDTSSILINNNFLNIRSTKHFKIFKLL